MTKVSRTDLEKDNTGPFKRSALAIFSLIYLLISLISELQRNHRSPFASYSGIISMATFIKHIEDHIVLTFIWASETPLSVFVKDI